MLLQFARPPTEFPPVHIAFLPEDQFGLAKQQTRAEQIERWADPQRTRPAETNTECGGRDVDPFGNYLELIIRLSW